MPPPSRLEMLADLRSRWPWPDSTACFWPAARTKLPASPHGSFIDTLDGVAADPGKAATSTLTAAMTTTHLMRATKTPPQRLTAALASPSTAPGPPTWGHNQQA